MTDIILKRPNKLGSNELAHLLPWTKHTTDNIDLVNAGLGSVGELLSSYTVPSLPLASGTAIDVTSLTLSPGSWDLSGIVGFAGVPGAVNGITGAISLVSATIGTGGLNTVALPLGPTAAIDAHISIPTVTLTVIVTTPIYLVALASFGAGACGAYGSLTARRAVASL